MGAEFKIGRHFDIGNSKLGVRYYHYHHKFLHHVNKKAAPDLTRGS